MPTACATVRPASLVVLVMDGSSVGHGCSALMIHVIYKLDFIQFGSLKKQR